MLAKNLYSIKNSVLGIAYWVLRIRYCVLGIAYGVFWKGVAALAAGRGGNEENILSFLLILALLILSFLLILALFILSFLLILALSALNDSLAAQTPPICPRGSQSLRLYQLVAHG